MKKMNFGGIGISTLLIAVAAFVLWRLWSKFTSPGGLFDPKKAELRDDAQKAIDSVTVNQKAAHLSKAQARQRADQLYQAFAGSGIAWFGTDEKMAFDAFKDCTPEDLKMIWKEFGIRKATAFGIPYFEGDLRGWFLAEFNESDLAKIEKIWAPTKLW